MKYHSLIIAVCLFTAILSEDPNIPLDNFDVRENAMFYDCFNEGYNQDFIQKGKPVS
jgi:hypothetical protein